MAYDVSEVLKFNIEIGV